MMTGQTRSGYSSITIEKDLSIALCTCEGSFFLPAQLESLARQTVLPGELVVCDDASTDNSLEIVEHFARQAPFAVKIFVNKNRLGVVKNFSQAIERCGGKYIALCDQDDVWQNTRLEIGLQVIKELEEREGVVRPLLLHSDMALIDESGRLIAESYMQKRKINHLNKHQAGSLMAQNFVTGNTVIFNQSLRELALPIPEHVVMHDWWLALVASLSGRVVFLDKQTVLYRVHRSNVVGVEGNFLKITA